MSEIKSSALTELFKIGCDRFGTISRKAIVLVSAPRGREAIARGLEPLAREQSNSAKENKAAAGLLQEARQHHSLWRNEGGEIVVTIIPTVT